MPDIPIELTQNAKAVEGEHNADNIKITLSEDMRGYPVYIVRRRDGYGKTSDSPRLYEQDGAVLMPLTEDILRGSQLKLQLIALNEDFTEVAKSEAVTLDVSASLRMSGEQKQKSKDLLAEMLEVLGRVDGAVDSIEGAVTDAKKAVENAEQAVRSANEAVEDANSATETANNAAEKADKAAENANSVIESTNEAAESANGAAASANAAAQRAEEAAENVQDGADGTTFTPLVDSDGNLMWTNSDGKPNPAPVNIKGAPGKTPEKNVDYFDGEDGVSPTVSVTETTNGCDFVLTDKNGEQRFSIKNGYTPVKNKDYFDGEDGDPLTYDDLTDEQKAELKGDRGAPGFEEWIEMTAEDTEVMLEPNKLYVFPLMTRIAYSLSADGEYHFVFFSGATPTEIVHPASILAGNLTVESNAVYEISILKNSMGGLLLSESWELKL